MNQRIASYLLCAAMATIDVIAFSTTSSILLRTNAALGVKNNLPSAQRNSRYAPLFSSPESATETEEVVDDYDVTCYVVNDEEIITEGEKPHVVCTSEPEEYAWFNGIELSHMRKTDGSLEGGEECVEGESYKGKPEWECE